MDYGRGRLILALASKRKAGYLMKYDLTKAEERKLRQILEASDQNIRNIEAQLATLKEGTPEYAALHKKGMTAQVEQLSIVLDYTQACYVKRFKKLGADAAAILEDGKETAAYILQDKVKSILEGRTVLNKPIEEKINAAWLVKDIQNTAPLTLHYEALQGNKEALEELTGYIVEIVIASPYTTEEPNTGGSEVISSEAEIITADSAIFKVNMPMYHGKATDALATLSSRDITANPIADKGILETEAGDYKIVIQDFSKIKGKLSVNTHKLLSSGIAEFTQINNYGGGAVNPKVTIPLNEYARLLGYEIDERETDSPEAAAKEKKRAAEALKTAKKRIRQDLELLQAMRWTWQEKVRGKGADFDSILLLERVAIRKGYIIMEFGRNMAEYLKQLPLTQYPQGLLAIDARNETAYKLGLKMAEHYSIDNNQIRGTANRLKVSTLLAVTQLPTFEMLQQETPDDSRHWDRRIKEPFETALDRLTGKVISSWEYVKAKGEPLTDAEAYNITDYDTFTRLLVQFELLEAPDHEDRLARRAAEKKAAAAKKAAKEKRGRKKKA